MQKERNQIFCRLSEQNQNDLLEFLIFRLSENPVKPISSSNPQECELEQVTSLKHSYSSTSAACFHPTSSTSLPV